jgi:hypothetical protein
MSNPDYFISSNVFYVFGAVLVGGAMIVGTACHLYYKFIARDERG